MARGSQKLYAVGIATLGLFAAALIVQAQAVRTSSITLKKDPSVGLFILTITDPDGIKEFSLQPHKKPPYGGGLNCPTTFENNNVLLSDPEDFTPEMTAFVIDCKGNSVDFKILPPQNGFSRGIAVSPEPPPPPPPPPPTPAPGAAPTPPPSAVPSGLSRADIKYPVAELDDCKSEVACRAYCKNTNNDINVMRACTGFAEKYQLVSKGDLEITKKLLQFGYTEGPGKCKSQKECEAYCEDTAHLDECVVFAEKVGLYPPDEIAESKKIAAALKSGIKLPGGCRGKAACETYCNNISNMTECVAFAEKTGITVKYGSAVLIEAGVFKGGPGGCKTKEQCEAYCGTPSRMAECADFGEKFGFMSKEEIEAARKIAKSGVTKFPGNCSGKAACDVYCKAEANFDECIEFAEKAGLASKDEVELAKKTRGKTPGDCAKGWASPAEAKKACSAFCAKVENQKVCMDFAIEAGLMTAEDAKELGGGGSMEDLNACLPFMDKETLACFDILGKDAFEKLRKGEMPEDIGVMKEMLRKMKDVKACAQRQTDVTFGKVQKDFPDALACLAKDLGEDPVAKIKSGAISCRQMAGMQDRLQGCFMDKINAQMDECLAQGCSEFNSCLKKKVSGNIGGGKADQTKIDPAFRKKVDDKANSCAGSQIEQCLNLDCKESLACFSKMKEAGGEGGKGGSGASEAGDIKLDPVLQDRITKKITACLGDKGGGPPGGGPPGGGPPGGGFPGGPPGGSPGPFPGPFPVPTPTPPPPSGEEPELKEGVVVSIKRLAGGRFVFRIEATVGILDYFVMPVNDYLASKRRVSAGQYAASPRTGYVVRENLGLLFGEGVSCRKKYEKVFGPPDHGLTEGDFPVRVTLQTCGDGWGRTEKTLGMTVNAPGDAYVRSNLGQEGFVTPPLDERIPKSVVDCVHRSPDGRAMVSDWERWTRNPQGIVRYGFTLETREIIGMCLKQNKGDDNPFGLDSSVTHTPQAPGPALPPPPPQIPGIPNIPSFPTPPPGVPPFSIPPFPAPGTPGVPPFSIPPFSIPPFPVPPPLGAQSCAPAPSGLVSWWEGAGSQDIIGGNHPKEVIGMNQKAGKVRDAFQFASGHMNMGNPANLNFGTGPFSLEAWFNWDGGGSSINNIIRKSNYPVSGPGAGYWLRINKDSRIIEFSVGATTRFEGQSLITAPISSGVWHHVVGTRDSSDNIKLYIDGQSTGTVLRKAVGADSTSEAPFLLGAWMIDRSVAKEFFAGFIDEASVYNRALGASEVQAIFNAGSAGKCSARDPYILPKVPGVTPEPSFQVPPISIPPAAPPPASSFEVPATPENCAAFATAPSCSFVAPVGSQNYNLCKRCYPDR